MDFQILGALQVVGSGGTVLSFEPRHLRILAVLLLLPSQAVGREHLIDAVWDDAPPSTAGRQLQNCVSALRRALGRALVAEPAGYRIQVETHALDATRFMAHTAAAGGLAAKGSVAEAVQEFRRGLSLWRGPALSGMHGRAIEAGAARLNEQRLATLEECLDLELRLGRHHQLVGELIELVGAYPLRERLVGQLMLALHGSGRQSEALHAYERLRTALAQDLGLDPGSQIQELHGRILRNEPALHDSPDRRQVAGVRAESVVPRQLPPAPRHFVGRIEQLAELEQLVSSAGGEDVVIAAIDGTGGIGKTSLAVRWAHHVAPRFPDGQLFANLRGFDPAGPPVAPAHAIRAFLDALGVAAEQIPSSLEAQTNLYRSLVAGRRVLVVLDNAHDIEQVRPLLPGSGTCFVVVTSRNRLTGLVVAEGARSMTLELLTTGEAHRLLATRVAESRLAAEPDAVDELIRHCSHLPLALAIIAARAAERPTFPLAVFAAELADAQRRLDAVDGGDQYTQVRAVFSWSYHRLAAQVARMFRLLGLHTGPDISIHAAASLAGVSLSEARQLLRDLARARLLGEDSPGRYALHDLLSAYAQEEARAHELEEEQRAATHRMLDHYLHTAYRADRLLYPRRDPITLQPPIAGVVPERPVDIDGTLIWFHTEHRVLMAAVERATQSHMDSHCQQLAWALASFLERRGHWRDWLLSQQAAWEAATRAGDMAGQGTALRGMGRANTSMGHPELARAHLLEALEVFKSLGDRTNEAHGWVNLAQTFELEERFEDAIVHAMHALELYNAVGHELGQANALNAAGYYHTLSGAHHEAIDYCARALAIHRKIGHQLGQANTLHSLGYAHHRLGDQARAVSCFEEALELYSVIRAGQQESTAFIDLGDAHLARGEHQAALKAWERALEACARFSPSRLDDIRARIASLPDV